MDVGLSKTFEKKKNVCLSIHVVDHRITPAPGHLVRIKTVMGGKMPEKI